MNFDQPLDTATCDFCGYEGSLGEKLRIIAFAKLGVCGMACDWCVARPLRSFEVVPVSDRV